MLEKQAILAKSLLLQLFLQVSTVRLVMNQPKNKNLTLVQLVCLTLNTSGLLSPPAQGPRPFPFGEDYLFPRCSVLLPLSKWCAWSFQADESSCPWTPSCTVPPFPFMVDEFFPGCTVILLWCWKCALSCTFFKLMNPPTREPCPAQPAFHTGKIIFFPWCIVILLCAGSVPYPEQSSGCWILLPWTPSCTVPPFPFREDWFFPGCIVILLWCWQCALSWTIFRLLNPSTREPCPALKALFHTWKMIFSLGVA